IPFFGGYTFEQRDCLRVDHHPTVGLQAQPINRACARELASLARLPASSIKRGLTACSFSTARPPRSITNTGGSLYWVELLCYSLSPAVKSVRAESETKSPSSRKGPLDL